MGLSDGPTPTNLFRRKAVVISIMLVISLVHFLRVGTYLDGIYFTLYYSFFSDVFIPFGLYFLLCAGETSFGFLADWWIKATIVFGGATFTEIMQSFDIYFFGTTYDPVDIVMFAMAALLAAFVDRVLFWRYLPGWRTDV
jgi:hypothetical protein